MTSSWHHHSDSDPPLLDGDASSSASHPAQSVELPGAVKKRRRWVMSQKDRRCYHWTTKNTRWIIDFTVQYHHLLSLPPICTAISKQYLLLQYCCGITVILLWYCCGIMYNIATISRQYRSHITTISQQYQWRCSPTQLWDKDSRVLLWLHWETIQMNEYHKPKHL